MGAHGLRETEVGSLVFAWFLARFSPYVKEFCWTFNTERVSLPALRTLFFHWVALSSLHLRAFTLPYFTFFCHVWLVCLGGLLPSTGNQRQKGSCGEDLWKKRGEGAGSSGERGNCDRLYCLREEYIFI